MRILSVFTIGFVIALCSLSARGGEKKKTDVAFDVYAKGYFVKNTAKLPGNPAFLILPDKKAYDEIFGIGFVMGAKPKLVTDKLFDKNVIVTLIKSGNTIWKYEVDSVRLDKARLVVRYTAKGKESASAKFNSPLILSVPRGEYTEVVFMEGDKEAGKVAVKK
ncbi:MAG TPA: hypothetical protein VFE62_08755 [Gemmataceae bacterium]|nr:hypothetical protein [Gemmataceae bacterium]